MFVRNVGDEGFCSRHLWPARFTTHTFRLPWREKMTGVNVSWGYKATRFEGTAGTSGPTITWILPPSSEKGVYVTFTLPSASQSPVVDGVLRLQWTGTIALQRKKQSRGGVSEASETIASGRSALITKDEREEAGDPDAMLRFAIEQLPPDQHEKVTKAAATATARPVLHPLPPGGAAKRLAVLPATSPAPITAEKGASRNAMSLA